MAQPIFSIDELSERILADVDRDLKKTAGPTYIKDRAKTDLGRGLSKLAEALRNFDPGELTWTDVAEFRRRHGG
jgi:hypothetical protein